MDAQGFQSLLDAHTRDFEGKVDGRGQNCNVGAREEHVGNIQAISRSPIQKIQQQTMRHSSALGMWVRSTDKQNQWSGNEPSPSSDATSDSIDQCGFQGADQPVERFHGAHSTKAATIEVDGLETTSASQHKPSRVSEGTSSSTPSSPLTSSRNVPDLARVAPLLTEANHELLDKMVTDYYCADYRSQPPAAHEQRKSRRRGGLASFLSKVFHCSQGWTSWERDGLHNELVKASEAVLRSEAQSARASLRGVFQSVLLAGGRGGGSSMSVSASCGERELLSLKDGLAQEAPHLWTMAMAVAASSGQQPLGSDCSARVLAALFILFFPELLNETDLVQKACNML